MNIKIRPEIFALLAAIANGTIGPLNRFGFAAGADHHSIAFIKCFGAFLLLLIFCLLRSNMRKELFEIRSQTWKFALLSFLGVFCLYFFETWAFAEASIPLVSFLIYAAGGGTILLSAIVLKEKIGIAKIIAFGFLLCGVWFIYAYEGNVSGTRLGIILALLGGLGYALFIFTSKLFNVKSGIPQLVWLFGFGSLYLFIPWGYSGFTPPPMAAYWSIGLLIILPTIGGFWLTTRAIQDGEASTVQIIETSDPLFASILAFFIFGDTLSEAGMIGATLIMTGLLVALYKPDWFKKLMRIK